MTVPRTGYVRVTSGRGVGLDPNWLGLQISVMEKISLEGRCRMCQRPWHVRPPTRHHLLPTRWFRMLQGPARYLRNVPANIIPLCRDCHDYIEHDVEGRRMLRRSLTQMEISFAIKMRGEAWFNRIYPRTAGGR